MTSNPPAIVPVHPCSNAGAPVVRRRATAREWLTRDGDNAGVSYLTHGCVTTSLADRQQATIIEALPDPAYPFGLKLPEGARKVPPQPGAFPGRTRWVAFAWRLQPHSQT